MLKLKRSHANHDILNHGTAPLVRVCLRQLCPVALPRYSPHKPNVWTVCSTASTASAMAQHRARPERGMNSSNSRSLTPGRSIHAVVDHMLAHLFPVQHLSHQRVPPKSARVRVLDKGWHPHPSANSKHRHREAQESVTCIHCRLLVWGQPLHTSKRQ